MHLKTISLENEQDGGRKPIGKFDKNVCMDEISEKWTSSGILWSKTSDGIFKSFFMCRVNFRC